MGSQFENMTISEVVKIAEHLSSDTGLLDDPNDTAAPTIYSGAVAAKVDSDTRKG